MYVVANHVLLEADAPKKNDGVVQLDLFTDYAVEEEKQKAKFNIMFALANLILADRPCLAA